MKRIILSGVLMLLGQQVLAQSATTGPTLQTAVIANDTGTGTTVNKLAKLNSSSKVVVTATTDTDGAIGVVISNAGTSGNAQVASAGIVKCAFDGTATAGHFVQISGSVAGDCKDSGGASRPSSGGQVIGYVLVGGTGANTYTIALALGNPAALTALTVGSTGIGSGTTTRVLFDNAGVLGEYAITGTGSVAMSASPTFTGTVTVPVLAAASSLQFQSNGTTFAGGINASQQWYLGPNNVAPPTSTIFTVSKNVAAVPQVSAVQVATFAGADASSAVVAVQSFGTGQFPGLFFAGSRGTAASPTNTQSTDTLGLNFFLGNKAGTFTSGGGLGVTATENWDSTHQGARLDLYGAPAGNGGATANVHVQSSLMVGTTTDGAVGQIMMSNASFLMRNTVAWTNGAAAATGTLTNAPAAGNPTKWIPIDDNGTTRFIPSW